MGTRKLREEVEADAEPREPVLLAAKRPLGACVYEPELCEPQEGMVGKEPYALVLRLGGAALEKWRPSALAVERGVDEEDEACLESLRRSLKDLEGACEVPMPSEAGTCEVEDVELIGGAVSRFELLCRGPTPKDEAIETGVRCIVEGKMVGCQCDEDRRLSIREGTCAHAEAFWRRS